MAKHADRFEMIYVQKVTLGSSIEIWVDKETGVNYIYRRDGYSGGAEGKPVVSKADSAGKE